jgi:hypothetical protein
MDKKRAFRNKIMKTAVLYKNNWEVRKLHELFNKKVISGNLIIKVYSSIIIYSAKRKH